MYLYKNLMKQYNTFEIKFVFISTTKNLNKWILKYLTKYQKCTIICIFLSIK